MKHTPTYTKVLTTQHTAEVLWMRTVFGTLAALALIYVYLVALSIFNIMAQKQADLASGRMETSMTELQTRYFAIHNAITKESGVTIGLVAAAAPIYITRPSGTLGTAATAPKPITDTHVY